jgi:hypothetical protein
MSGDDLLLEGLSRALADQPALAPAVADRVRARARAALTAPRPLSVRALRWMTSAAMASAVVVYLTWAASFLSALAR